MLTSKINSFLSCNTSSNLNFPPTTLNYTIAKGDSGATNHYFAIKDANTLLQVTPDANGPMVTLPNKACIKATHQGHLPYTKYLSPQATKTSLFPNLHNNLISIGQLCDDGCEVLFTQSTMTVKKNSNIIFRGHRSTTDGLWNIHLPQTSPSPSPNFATHTPGNSPTDSPQHSAPSITPSLNVIIRKSTTAKDLAIYMHATCFSPARHTLLKAIKNNHFIGWPGFTESLVLKHLPLTIATAKGHLKQERQGLQSTSKANSIIDENLDMYPPPDEPNLKTYDAIYSITSKENKAFMDLTGRFPHCSSRGNEY